VSVEADEKDIEILRLLQRDAKISAREIAIWLGALSPPSTPVLRVLRTPASSKVTNLFSTPRR